MRWVDHFLTFPADLPRPVGASEPPGMPFRLLLPLGLLAASCGGSASSDAGPLDAPVRDTPAVDAPADTARLDAPGDDAPDDTGPDGAPSDAAADGGMDAGSDAGPRCLAPFACPGDVRLPVAWASEFSGSLGYLGGVALDATGGFFAGGAHAGPVDFGGGPLPLSGGRDLFLVRLDAGGALLWTRRFDTGDDDVAITGVAIGPSGELFVAGYGPGTIDFGAGPTSAPPAGGLRPGFVAAFDAGGAFRWAARFAQLTVGGVVALADGAPVAVGTFNGTVNVGTGALTSGPGGSDVLLFALEPADGAARWARQLGETDRVDRGPVLAIGPSDDLWVGASFTSSVGADSGFWIERRSAAGASAFRIRHATTAALPSPELASLAVDGAGALAAVLKGTFDLGAGPATEESFVARFDGSGVFEWQRAYNLDPRRVAFDASGRTWITGAWSGVRLSVRPVPCLFSAATSGSFVLALDAEGTLVESSALDGGDPFVLAARGARVVVGGRSTGMPDLGCGPTTSGFEEPFLVAFAP